MWQLTAKYGKRKGRSWPIADTKITIGRNPSCTIKLRDPLVSREHCQVIATEDRIELVDLGSANSTLVNGKAASRCTLRLGDELVVGDATFIVTQTDPEDFGSSTSLRLVTTQQAPGGFAFGGHLRDMNNESLTVSELALAHRFALLAAACETTEALFEQLKECVYEHCSPVEFFLVPKERDHAPAYIHPSRDELERDVQQTLDSIIAKPIEHIKFLRRENAEGMDVFTSFVPLWVGGQFVGVMGGSQEATNTHRVEPDVNFAIHLSRVLAPFLLALSYHQPASPAVPTGEAAAAFLGSSEAAQEARRLIEIAATADVPILIQGETGTGKELAAKLIHELSTRRNAPIVIANCAAIAEDLFESEVFGHVKGAFTGSTGNRPGMLAEANGGHLFLDEIADLSERNQARLLRAIETKLFRPLGGSEDRASDFCVISASNRDLWQEVEAGRFRADLYYRLAAIEFFLPPLSDRLSDLPELARYFSEQFAAERGASPTALDESAIALLASQPWHGNVRELRNCINKISTFAPGRTVSKAEVETILARRPRPVEKNVRQIRDLEREHIERVLAECGGRIQDAAKVLGIHRNTLTKKLKQYGHSS